jgi:hypothetical protein
MDMSSGGTCKVPPFEWIYIEAASAEEAAVVFYSRFGRDPYNVTCDCCGPDYSITSWPTLSEASGYDRKAWFASHKDVTGSTVWSYFDSQDQIPEGWTPAARWQGTARVVSVDEYCDRDDVLIIREVEIWHHERTGPVPPSLDWEPEE